MSIGKGIAIAGVGIGAGIATALTAGDGSMVVAMFGFGATAFIAAAS